MVLYTNKYYNVVLTLTGYNIVNKYTNVVEDTSTKLPTAIYQAIASNKALEKLINDDKNTSTGNSED